MVKTIIYVALPLIIIWVLRKKGRRLTSGEPSSAPEPSIPTKRTEDWIVTESLQETMTREQKKMEKELREVFGRQDSVLPRTKKEFNRSTAPQEARSAESPERNEKNMLQEELLKLFSRR